MGCECKVTAEGGGVRSARGRLCFSLVFLNVMLLALGSIGMEPRSGSRTPQGPVDDCYICIKRQQLPWPFAAR